MSIYSKDKTDLFLGYFTNLAEIQNQYPIGEDGQYAGANDVKKLYYWDVSARAWTDSGDVYTGVIDVGDIEIGAVEIKDATSDTRAVVGAVSAVVPSTNGFAVSDPTSMPCSIPAEYASPYDFTATYTSNVTITITGAPFTVDDTTCVIVGILYKPTAGSWTRLYNGKNGVSMNASSGVITVTGAGTPFAAGDTYRVAINYQRKAYDSTLDITKTVDQSPDRSSYIQNSLIDTTNVAAGTAYLPSATGFSQDGFKDFSLTGKFIDADGTITMTVEITNDEDQVNADFIQVYGYDTKNNAVVNSWTVTNGTLTFAIDFDNLNYSYMRIKIVNDGATNTMIVKSRQKSL